MPTDEIFEPIGEWKSEFLKRRISVLENSRKDVLKKISDIINSPLNMKNNKISLEKYLNDLDSIDEWISRVSESLSESLEKEKKESSLQKKNVDIGFGEFIPYYSTSNVMAAPMKYGSIKYGNGIDAALKARDNL